MRILIAAGIAASLLATTTLEVNAKSDGGSSYKGLSKAARIERANSGTVGIISGGIGGTYIRIATDLASVLNGGDDLRILPIVGQGSIRNINDILYLRGIDVGIVQSDVLAYIKRQNEHPNIEHRINYITKLYNEELHLIAGPRIKKVQDLKGRKVNFGLKGSGTSMTASTVFRQTGVRAIPVHMDQALAIEKIKRGEIAATVYVAGKPARVVSDLKARDRLHIVPIAYSEPLQSAYLPARFTHEDYPGLIARNQKVDSIAVGAVMAVYNWQPGTERYEKVARFIDVFFAKFGQFLKPPRHKKWQEVNLAAKVPGWTRFAAAEERLRVVHDRESSSLKTAFEKFLDQFGGSLTTTAVRGDQAGRETLFRQFMTWRADASIR